MSLRRGIAAAVAVTGLFWPAIVHGAMPAKPKRIVSLNLCTDQILMDLVAPERIRAVSHLAADERLSLMAKEAKAFPATRGEAEDVLRLEPDLVIASTWTTPATVALLQRLGQHIVVVPQPETVDGIRDAVAQVAAAVGESDTGARQIERFDRRIATARFHHVGGGLRPSAVLYQIGGIVAGAGSLADVALSLAGFDNLAVQLSYGPTDTLPLETLVAHPPDLILFGHKPGDYRTVVADNLTHPALRYLAESRPVGHVREALWLCGTVRWAEAVEQLAEARRRLDRR